MIIISALYFFLPAYIANMAPVLFKNSFFKLAKPVDMGKKHKGRRVLGDNKTWRGLIVGIVLAMLTALLQYFLHSMHVFNSIILFDYQDSLLLSLMLGFLLGLGALVGDMVKSYFKRGMSFRPGQSWFPFDQMDFVFGGLLFSSLIFFPGWFNALTILVLSPLLHVIVRLIGYGLGIDDTKF